MSHPTLIGGAVPAGPSAIRSEGKAFVDGELVPYSEPRALHLSEIPAILAEYSRAALRALEAGFDGVELHAANGYLPDQFLEDGTNRRTDTYGGSVENRARFLLEAFDMLAFQWGANRVGVRISPTSTVNGMHDSNPLETFSYVATRLSELGPAYLHIAERKGPDGTVAVGSKELRPFFSGPIIVASGYDKSRAEEALSSGNADLIAFGRPFVSNPDLPRRIRDDLPLTPHDAHTLYVGGPVGFTDYSAHPISYAGAVTARDIAMKG
jgi:N-ethylmaleimide reductase